MKTWFSHRSPVALAATLVIAAAAFPAVAQTNMGSTGATAAQPSNTTMPANSGDATSHAPQKLSAQDKEALKLSQDGFNAMRDVRAARIAIFEGNPKAAHDMLAKADSSLQAASKDATAMQGDSPSNSSAGASGTKAADYVAVDGQITLVDAFVDSPAKKTHIDKANQSIAKGDSKSAMDELKLADVGASFTRVLMPLQQTRDHVDAAGKLVDQKKYYEANLALKAAEDGMLVDSILLTEVPKPQTGSTTGKPAAAPGGTATGKSAG